MQETATYISIENLDAYKLAREYSRIAWQVYELMDWQTKKIMGDQTISSVDSVGANIAEGYGRFHYLDKIKFYYNARGSLIESKHWIDLLCERKIINDVQHNTLTELYKRISTCLNGLIKSQYMKKNNQP